MAKSATSLLIISVFHCCFLLSLSQAKDTLKPGEDLREAKTLVSSNGVFELGFFSSSSSSSSNHYLGIWFKNDPNKKPVWVANRENPILDSSGVLSIRYDGNLVIVDRRQIPIIVNSGMLATTTNTSSTLLDSGNLRLGDGDNIVWQSFDYPSDTLLPGMRLGWFNLGTQHLREQFLVSWQSLSVPATGSFALGLDSNNGTQVKVWQRNGVSRQIAFWDGQRLKFMIESSSEDYNFSFVSKPDEVYITFNTRENYTSSWFVMSSTGQIQEYKMLGQKISMVNRSICENTTVSDATDCYIVRPSLCQDGDKFSEIKGGNCSCTAFASFRDDGTGCEFYYGDKRALLGIIGVGKSIIYVRGDILPKPGDTGEQNSRRLRLLVIITVVSLLVPIIVALICYIQWRKQGGKGNEDSMRRSLERFLFQIGSNVAEFDEDKPEDRYNRKKDHELPLLSFSCMATATNNFSDENKLGEGGFGPVYKGALLGHEIAVKRLSKNLDSFLFDPTKKILLDWKNRVFIIEGIAQGLLYLHKIFGEDEVRAKTNRVVGTYGYMSPEYVFEPTRICLGFVERRKRLGVDGSNII
nr:g-type lectin s-receptor-like serine/threonine-protein kinase [Quercus suber]